MTDKDIAGWLNDLYAYQDGLSRNLDFVDPGASDGVCWATKRVDGADVILLRGSRTFQDWLRDLIALAAPWRHDKLGPVHPGFCLGMDQVWAEIFAKTKGPRVLAGHSLGAGRAAILAGLMTASGYPPAAVITFGMPKPGFRQLADLLQGIPQRSYRNGDSQHHDLVTDVPLSFPPEEYVHPAPLTYVTAMPDPVTNRGLGVFAWHHLGLYQSVTPEAVISL